MLRGLLLALSAFLLLALGLSYFQEFKTNQKLTPLSVLETPHSSQVLIMNFLFQKIRRMSELRPDALRYYLNDYTSPPDPSFDLFYLPKRDNYCQANFLHVMLNIEARENYVFMDAPNTDKLKKSLNHDFDFLNSVVYRQKDYTKKEIERLQNMEWSPKIKLFFTRTNTLYNNVIGRTSVCIFQMASKIPGSSIFHRTDLLVDKIKNNIETIDSKSRVKVADFFPTTLRLYDTKECQQFFGIIQSKKFKAQMKHRVVFMIKNASHTREDNLDYLEIHKLARIYKRGALCGQIKNLNIIQEYNNNQLKFKNGRKFVLRVYMSVISTDPLVVLFHRGIAILDRFNNYVSFNKAVVDAKEVFDYMRETGSLNINDEDIIYANIKSIVYELNELARPHYLNDHRFFQTFAFDFILTQSKKPILVNWSGAPHMSFLDAKLVSKLLRIEMNLLHEKTIRIRDYLQNIRNKIMIILKDNRDKLEYLEDFVYQIDQLDDFKETFNKKLRELMKNPVKSLKSSDFEGLELLHSEISLPGVQSASAA